MKKCLLLSLLLLAASQVFASQRTPMTKTEINALNFLLQCPAEVAELSKVGGHRIMSGESFTDRSVIEGRTYHFVRSTWMETKSIGILTVSRIRRPNPPSDAANFTISCEIMYQK